MRIPVPLPKAYLLLNHGPTTLVTAMHEKRANVMAAAWVMALDIDPPKVIAVISSDAFTRSLIEKSGEFGLSLPSTDQVDLTYSVGNSSGSDVDKFKTFGIGTFPGKKVETVLVDGCLGWLECKLVPEPHVLKTYDLLIAEVVAAWVDDSVFDPKKGWKFQKNGPATIHHLTGTTFTCPGRMLEAKKL
ncbi:MAG: flavin reductase family protein [Pseudomonadota bacterium]